MGTRKIVGAAVALLMLPGIALAQAATTAAPAEAVAAPVAEQAQKPGDAAVPAASPAAATEAAPAAEAKTIGTLDIGQPRGDWRLQETVTPIGELGTWFNDVLLLPLMTAVTVLVFGLLLYAMWRFRAKANPVASKTSHNTLIEVIWTAVPVLILVIIAVPSFRLLADQYDPPKPDLTIKATGHQWYWEYQYPDHGELGFDAVMLTDDEAKKAGVPRLLETDNRVVVPAGAVVKVLVTAADVGHSWAVPAFWVKMDAWPGRINETWFKVDRPGVYYGQCSELCGTRHGFMPITVEVMEPARFNAWMDAKQKADGAELSGPRYQAGPNGKLITIAQAAPAAAPAPEAAAAAPAADAAAPAAPTPAAPAAAQ